MATIAFSGFPARPGSDRNAFLLLTLLIWAAVLSGFGTDSFAHISKHGLDFPLIVHFHAVVFVSYLVLFTTQVALIRGGRADLHRRLGVVVAALAGVMLVLGPATALTVDGAKFAATGHAPTFLAVQLTDILAFAGLTGAGLMLRGVPSAHKRLMLLGLIYISDAGFARFLNPLVAGSWGDGFWGDMGGLYLGSDLLLLALGAYDLVSRRRLHPAYIAGAVWMIALQLSARTLLHSPGWKAVSLHLIGH